MRTKIILPFFLALSLIALMMPILYYPSLPESVAIHFNAGGEADRWSSKDSFITYQIIILLLMILLFGLMALFVKRMPHSLINLPNKSFWLNEVNKNNTYEYLRSTLLILGTITISFLTIIFYESLNANITGTNKMSGNFWIYFSVFLLATVFFTIRMITYFSKKNSPNKEES